MTPSDEPLGPTPETSPTPPAAQFSPAPAESRGETFPPSTPSQISSVASGDVPLPRRSGVQRWLTPALALVAVAVVALFGGILIGQHTAPTGQATGFSRAGGAGGFGQGPGTGVSAGAGGTGPGARAGGFGGPTAGTIVSISGNTITVKERTGSTITVTTSSSTTVTKSTPGALSDLKAGEAITVRGATGSDGSITATSVSQGAQPFGGRAAAAAANG